MLGVMAWDLVSNEPWPHLSCAFHTQVHKDPELVGAIFSPSSVCCELDSVNDFEPPLEYSAEIVTATDAVADAEALSVPTVFSTE